jgi:hypothetical protein
MGKFHLVSFLLLGVSAFQVGVSDASLSPFSGKKAFARLPDVTTQAKSSWEVVPRGGEATGGAEASKSVVNMASDAIDGLKSYMEGPKSDTLLLLLTTALNTPICKMLGSSPILGFLALGVLFGPNGLSLIADVHKTEMIADLGIVFFLFEMGIHLDFKTLMSMRKDVFGLGGCQFLITAAVVALIAGKCGMSFAAQIIFGRRSGLVQFRLCASALEGQR